MSSLGCEFLVCLGKCIGWAGASWEDDVGETGVESLVTDGPDGDPGEDLAERHGLFYAKGMGGEIGRGGATFCDDEAGTGIDGANEVGESLGDCFCLCVDWGGFFFVAVIAGGEEDGGFSGGDGGLCV